MGYVIKVGDSKSKQAIVDRLTKNVKHSDILEHHGIKGQRWGVRRFQNPDGSLTAAGRRRMNIGDSEESKKTHNRKNVKDMDNQELDARINRLKKEQEYIRLKDDPNDYEKKQKRAERIKKIVTAAAVTTAVVTILKNKDALKERADKFFNKEKSQDGKKVADTTINELKKTLNDLNSTSDKLINQYKTPNENSKKKTVDSIKSLSSKFNSWLNKEAAMPVSKINTADVADKFNYVFDKSTLNTPVKKIPRMTPQQAADHLANLKKASEAAKSIII